MRGRTFTLVVASGAVVSVLACARTPPPPPPKTVSIAIADIAFVPLEVTARVGDTIEWTNKDIFDHTGTARDGAWDVAVEPGKSGRVVVKAAGTMEYYCKLHPTMVGKIVVTR